MSSRTVWRKEQCQVCGRFVDRATLRRVAMTVLNPLTENRFLYSEPVLGGWSTTATASTDTCYGSRLDAFTKFSPAGVASVVNGSRYYTGTGYVYTSSTYDCSAWTSLLFRGIVNNHPMYGGHFVVQMGVAEANCVNPAVIKTYTSHWDARYLSMPVAIAALTGYDPAALCFFIHVTPTDAASPWVADSFQLVRDPTGFIRGTQTPVVAADITSATYVPLHYYPFARTTGVAYANATEKQGVTKVVSCPRCRDERLRVNIGTNMRVVEMPEEPIQDTGDVDSGNWR